jgi:hypothetical protein
MPVDLDPHYMSDGILTAHYGSPVITAKNTIIVPVKTGAWAGFRIDARNGDTGQAIYHFDSDYATVSAEGWIASFGPAISPNNTLFVPASAGSLMFIQDADKFGDGPVRTVFYGGKVFGADPELYTNNVKVCTPVTVDAKNNAWYGFRTYGNSADDTPIGQPLLLSGIAKVNSLGVGAWRSVKDITDDATATHIQLQCAPAICDDGSTVYFGVQVRNGGGYLVGIDTATLKTKYKARLFDPSSGNVAILSDQSTASPMIGPDGDVYFGVLSNPQEAHNRRGYLLHFDKTLQTAKVSGGFGWDSTPSMLPTAGLHGYKGKSPYLIVTKYNNYALFGDGINRVALLDPIAMTDDFITGVNVMNELETIVGPTADPQYAGPDYPDACYEWCVNAAAVDVANHSALVNSEDGRLYRWDLLTNRITEGVMLDGPRGQAYTPTIIGPTGVTYAINNARLFAVGK